MEPRALLYGSQVPVPALPTMIDPDVVLVQISVGKRCELDPTEVPFHNMYEIALVGHFVALATGLVAPFKRYRVVELYATIFRREPSPDFFLSFSGSLPTINVDDMPELDLEYGYCLDVLNALQTLTPRHFTWKHLHETV